jgi:predicted permease
MTRIRVFLLRAVDLVLRRRRDERLSEEIQTHMDLLVAEQRALGLNEEEAHRAARRAFGGVARITEQYQDQRGLPMLDATWQDLRLAIRQLWRAPGFAFSAVAVLGLGIGVNNMLFTILNAHTIRGLPMPDADRVLYITTRDDRSSNLGVSFLDFSDWQAGARTFEQLAAFTTEPIVVSGDGRTPSTFTGTFISHSAFALVATQPMLGRDFTPEDDEPGAPAVIILGAGTWDARYARDPGVLGRSITVNGTPAVIVGVMPERSGFPTSGQIWLPLVQVPGLRQQARDARSLSVIGRVRDGVALSQAQADIETISGQIASAHPATNTQVRARVVPVSEQYIGSLTHPAWRAFIAVGVLVVLISCANAANLMLARSLNRSREIAVRTALGASRMRIIRQLCVEGATLAVLAGAFGLVIAVAGVRLFSAGIPAGALPYWIEYSPDARVFAALVAVSAATVLLFALLPAIKGSKPDLNIVLKEGGRTAIGARGRHWATVFLGAEFGLAVILLANFVGTLRGAAPQLPSDAGLRTTVILTAEMALPAAVYVTAERRSAFFQAVGDRLGALTAISSMSVASALPLAGGESRRVEIMDRPVHDKKDQQTVVTVAVAPRYFATLGLGIARGRDFTADDGSPGRPFVIVNERFVEKFSPDRDPIGQRIAVSRNDSPAPLEWLTIAGVAPTIRQRPIPSPDAVVYLPLRSLPEPRAALIVRSDMRTDALSDLLRDEMQRLDRNLPLNRMRTMAQVVRDAEWVGRVSRNLFRVLTFIAVMLASLGLYAVTSYAVSQQTHEIGLRMALGAGRRHVVWFIARRVARQLAIGLGAGVVCTRIWSSIFSTGRAGVTFADVEALLGVAVILIAIAIVACFVPVRRAIRLDPVAAIRND